MYDVCMLRPLTWTPDQAKDYCIVGVVQVVEADALLKFAKTNDYKWTKTALCLEY